MPNHPIVGAGKILLATVFSMTYGIKWLCLHLLMVIYYCHIYGISHFPTYIMGYSEILW